VSKVTLETEIHGYTAERWIIKENERWLMFDNIPIPPVVQWPTDAFNGVCSAWERAKPNLDPTLAGYALYLAGAKALEDALHEAGWCSNIKWQVLHLREDLMADKPVAEWEFRIDAYGARSNFSLAW
jgi:hypothetical protein